MKELESAVVKAATAAVTKAVQDYFEESSELREVHTSLLKDLDMTDKELQTDFIKRTQKVVYSHKVKLPGQSTEEHEAALAVIESLSDTGMSTEKFLYWLRPYIPGEYHINVNRDNARITAVTFSPGRKGIKQVFEESSLSEFLAHKDELSDKDMQFVSTVLRKTGRLRHKDMNAYNQLVWDNPTLAAKALFIWELLLAQKKSGTISEAYKELFGEI